MGGTLTKNPVSCYIAGPMRGLPEYNFPSFDAAKVMLLDAGWQVASPADIDREHGHNPLGGELQFKEYMYRDLAAVCASDAVFVLPGWTESQGAKLEVFVAHECELPVYTLLEGREVTPLEHPINGRRIDYVVDEVTNWPKFTTTAIEGNLERLGAPRETLPTSSEERKNIPITTGVLDYFPAALAAVAALSKAGNDKHNLGETLHWSRGKSTDQADCIGRHLIERGGIDPDTGHRHSTQLAWRALALLQVELEEAGEAPRARGAR